jgi:hypothetical protein
MSATLAAPLSTRWVPTLGRSFGVAVLTGFATWWGWRPATYLPIPPAVTHAVLVMAGLMLFVAAVRAIAAGHGPSVPVDRRLMMISMIAEVLAILIGTNLVASLGRSDLVLPVVGLVVGLHFLPMAQALSYPPYRLTGLAITTLAVVSMAFPGSIGLTILGAGTGATLWLTALHLTLRLRAWTRAARSA